MNWDIEADLAQEGAMIGLLALMRGISEEYWAAGWISGLEYVLWNVKGGTALGQGEITERQATLLKLLSEEAVGWWRYGANGPEFLSTEEWKRHLGR